MFVSTWLKQGQHTFGGWSMGGSEHQAGLPVILAQSFTSPGTKVLPLQCSLWSLRSRSDLLVSFVSLSHFLVEFLFT